MKAYLRSFSFTFVLLSAGLTASADDFSYTGGFQTFDVLYLLASHPGIVFTREALLERVWTNDTHVTERSVDTLVKRVRQKVEFDTRDPKLIITVWGTGYKFADV